MLVGILAPPLRDHRPQLRDRVGRQDPRCKLKDLRLQCDQYAGERSGLRGRDPAAGARRPDHPLQGHHDDEIAQRIDRAGARRHADRRGYVARFRRLEQHPEFCALRSAYALVGRLPNEFSVAIDELEELPLQALGSEAAR
jgi:hypothetical protein